MIDESEIINELAYDKVLYYVILISLTVMAKNIGTLGKYDQRRL